MQPPQQPPRPGAGTAGDRQAPPGLERPEVVRRLGAEQAGEALARKDGGEVLLEPEDVVAAVASLQYAEAGPGQAGGGAVGAAERGPEAVRRDPGKVPPRDAPGAVVDRQRAEPAGLPAGRAVVGLSQRQDRRP